MKPATYWKLFGSPEFQFSKVSGFPVDIQKNLQHIGHCNHLIMMLMILMVVVMIMTDLNQKEK